jgi:hypothetical protein
MSRVVGVEVALDQLAPAERVVVSMPARPLGAQHAGGVTLQYAGPEAALVLPAVAALACAASALLCLGLVLGAPSTLAVLGAAWHGADCECATSGHGGHLGPTVAPLSKGRTVMSQVGSGALAAGLTLVAGGLMFGLTPVGDDCGSALGPKGQDSSSSRLACSASLAGRGNTAWTLVIAGVAVTVGGVAARRADEGSGGPVE